MAKRTLCQVGRSRNGKAKIRASQVCDRSACKVYRRGDPIYPAAHQFQQKLPSSAHRRQVSILLDAARANVMTRTALRWYHYALLVIAAGTMQCAPWYIPPPIRSTLNRPPTAAEMAELWVEPVDVSHRDLFYGIGGAQLAPDPHARYEFVAKKHDFWASSPGYTVRDPSGLVWSVKLGAEVQAEVVASRLIWAAGYHQPPVYYVDRWQLYKDGRGTLQPPARFRPKLARYKKRKGWSWHQNPFVGTRPYQGLLVLMLMLNNWDLTQSNNSIYKLREPWDGARRWYVVRDVGASFSRNRGTWFQGTRGDPEGFSHEGFIESVKEGRVVFAWSGVNRELFRNISPDDVRWIADRLAALTPQQWNDALRAGGYTPRDAGLIRRTLADRIAQARSL